MNASRASRTVAARPRRILVVDDDDAIRDALAQALSLADYEVETAGDGIDGLDLLETTSVDAIVLDLMMPRMDGWTMGEHLVQDPALRAIPVIVVSATTRERPSFADAMLMKPFDLDVLLDLVDRLVAASRPGCGGAAND